MSERQMITIPITADEADALRARGFADPFAPDVPDDLSGSYADPSVLPPILQQLRRVVLNTPAGPSCFILYTEAS